MSTIPTSLAEKQFNQHINPYLSKAKRGFVCSIPLYKIFNYILYRLHTGCQWERLPIDADPQDLQKKRLAGKPFTTTSESGAEMAAWNVFGRQASQPSNTGWTCPNSIWMVLMQSPRKVANRSPIKDARRPKPPISCPSRMQTASSSLPRVWWPAIITMLTISNPICSPLFGGSRNKAYPSAALTSMPIVPLTHWKLAKPVSIMV